MGKSLELPGVDGVRVGSFSTIPTVPPIGPDRLLEVLKRAEWVCREHAALTSYLRDQEAAAGRPETAAHYDRQGLGALLLVDDLRAMWTGDLALPLGLAEDLMHALTVLAASVRRVQQHTAEPTEARAG